MVHEIDGRPAYSENANLIVDCQTPVLADPVELEGQVRGIPGVVGTGLFLGMAHTVLVGDEQRGFALVEERQRP